MRVKLNGQKDSTNKFVFPGLLVFLFVVAVASGINGSSVGAYNYEFHGHKYADKNLVFGVPQPVRGDEWLVITPMTASQRLNNYPVINRDIGNGQDMTVILDAPVKDWSTLLRPWSWGFFFLPFKNAFAFKWWAMLLALGLAAYWLVVQLFPRKYLFASLGALLLMASPYVQWWYREYTPGLLAFGLAGLLTMLSIHQAKTRRRKLLLVPLLAYLLAGFIFIQYPPFEILLAITVGLFYAGFLANLLTGKGMDRLKRLAVLKDTGLIIIAVLVALAVIGVFFEQHSTALRALEHTAYPGQRSYPSGQGNLTELAHLFSSNTMPFLQKHTAAVQSYFGNQSEASLFIQYSLILFVPIGAVIVNNFRHKKRTNWLLLALPAGMLIAYAYWFIPGLTTVFKPLLFDKVPVNRFEMMIGILDFFSLLVLAKEFPTVFTGRKTRRRLSVLSGAVALAVFLAADFYLRSRFPGLLTAPLMVLSAIWLSAALVLVLDGRKELGFAMLVVLSVASVYRVNPLYIGLDPLTDTPLAHYVQATSERDPQARWIATDRVFAGYLPANGARSLTGDYSYPQLSLWKTIDNNPADLPAYNRAVHAEAVIDQSNYIELHNVNTIYLHLDPCSPLMKKLNIKYLVTTNTYKSGSCLELQTGFPVDTGSVNVYKISPL